MTLSLVQFKTAWRGSYNEILKRLADLFLRDENGRFTFLGENENCGLIPILIITFCSTNIFMAIVVGEQEPHHPRGCVVQAWSVAEVLRVIKEYELYGVKKKSKEGELNDG